MRTGRSADLTPLKFLPSNTRSLSSPKFGGLRNYLTFFEKLEDGELNVHLLVYIVS